MTTGARAVERNLLCKLALEGANGGEGPGAGGDILVAEIKGGPPAPGAGETDEDGGGGGGGGAEGALEQDPAHQPSHLSCWKVSCCETEE